MSSRTTIRPHAVINAESMATSITSEPTLLQSTSKFSYQVVWSGTTPVGTLALQISNTYVPNADGTSNSSGTWTSVPVDVNGSEVTSISISGNTGDGFIDVTVQGGYASRLVYTRSSGTGTMTATVNGKVS